MRPSIPLATALLTLSLVQGCSGSPEDPQTASTPVSASRAATASWPSLDSPQRPTSFVDGPTYGSAEELAERGPVVVEFTFTRRVAETTEAELTGETDAPAPLPVVVWEARVDSPLTDAGLEAGDTLHVSALSGVSPVLDAIGVGRQAVGFLYEAPAEVAGRTTYVIAGVDQGLIPVVSSTGDLMPGEASRAVDEDTVEAVRKTLDSR